MKPLILKEKLDQYDYSSCEYMEEKEHDYASWIWLFFIRFSALEHDINGYISELINDRSHEIGYTIIEWLSFNNKIDLFSKLKKKLLTLFSKDKDSNLKKLQEVIKDLRDINTFRNKLAHANWHCAQKWWLIRTKIHSNTDDGFVELQSTRILPRNIKSKVTKIEKVLDNLFKISEIYF